MPYIKVSKTKSGAKSVQVASNAHGNKTMSVQKIVDQLTDTLSYTQQDTVTGETWMQHPDIEALGMPASLQMLLSSIIEKD
jgi:hypothetical protein